MVKETLGESYGSDGRLFMKRANKLDFLYEIKKDGVVIYESGHKSFFRGS